MVILETKYLELRTFKEDYIDDFMCYRNNLDWMKHQGFKGLTKQTYINRLINPFDIYKGVQLAVLLKSIKRLIGDVYLKVNQSTIDIGYTINPMYSQKGYTYEILDGVINFLKIKYPNHSIEADTSKENTASMNLLKKLGFVETHQTIDSCYFRYKKGDE